MKTFYISLSIERESKMHYKMCQTRKDLVSISRETGRYSYWMWEKVRGVFLARWH